MIQNILRTLGGIDHYGVFSLLLFASIATGVAVWAFTQRRSHLEQMARLPLENETEALNTEGQNHE